MNDIEKIIKDLASKKKYDREAAFRQERADKLAANKAKYWLCMRAFSPLLEVAVQSNMERYAALNPAVRNSVSEHGLELVVRFHSTRANPGTTHYEFYPDQDNPGELIKYRAWGSRISETVERLSTADAIAKFIDRFANAVSLEY